MLIDYRDIHATHIRIGDRYRGSQVDRIRIVGGRIVLQLLDGAAATLAATDVINIGRRT